MKKNMINTENIEGRIYEHDLTIKTVANQQSENFGKEFINGSLSVATDEEGLNVLTVHYTYVTEMTRGGKTNATYTNLKKIIDTGKTWVNDGKDAATKVRLTPSLALNDFYPQGGDELVSQLRNEGGFVSIVSDLNSDILSRRKFKLDVVINGAELVETEDSEPYVRVRCAGFNFRNDILPMTLVARSAGAMDYFLGLEATSSDPVFTQVWGEIVSTTVKVAKTVESAFGEPAVDVTERHQREWVITGAKPEPYVFDDESTITKEELSKAIADRNVYLETVKARAKEYYNNRGNAVAAPSTPAPSTQVPSGGFNF